MPSDKGRSIVDLDQLERIMWWGAAIGAVTTIVLITGEFRGWWNDAGEIGSVIVAVLTGLLTVVALLINATKDQASAIREGVTDNGRRLGLIHRGVQDVNTGLATIHEDNQQIHDSTQQLHEDNQQIYNSIQHLHEQTARQTEVLTEIRDRL